MNGNDLVLGLGHINESYVFEAAEEGYRKSTHFSTKHLLATAACIAIIVAAALFGLPNTPGGQNITPPGSLVNPPVVATDEPSTVQIDMANIFVNDLGSIADASRLYRDPALYDEVIWNSDDIIEYYGRDLTPAYIPDGLTASAGNGTQRVITSKEGEVAEDTLYQNYYNAYYDDGSPMLTDGINAVKGFRLETSKLGILGCCLYLLPEDEIKTSDIGGTEVTIGYRSMSYGPYDQQTHEPAGYYDMYVATFALDGIDCLIVASQMSLDDVVKVVSSIIYDTDDVTTING